MNNYETKILLIKIGKKTWQIDFDSPNSPKFFTAKVFYHMVVKIAKVLTHISMLSCVFVISFGAFSKGSQIDKEISMD